MKWLISLLITANFISSCHVDSLQERRRQMYNEGVGLPDWIHEPNVWAHDHYLTQQRHVLRSICFRGKYEFGHDKDGIPSGDMCFVTEEEANELLKKYYWR